MVRAVAVDRGDGRVERIDEADRDDVIEKLGGVVGRRGRRDGDVRAVKNCGAGRVAPQFDPAGAGRGKGAREGGQKCRRDGAVDEQLFRGVARAGPLYLRVERDGFGHREVGGGIDVDEAHALVVLDDGDGAVGRDKTDEAFAAAGNHAVDELVELEQSGERGAVGRGDELDGVFGQIRGGQRLANQCGERGVGVETLLAAPQNRGVAEQYGLTSGAEARCFNW